MPLRSMSGGGGHSAGGARPRLSVSHSAATATRTAAVPRKAGRPARASCGRARPSRAGWPRRAQPVHGRPPHLACHCTAARCRGLCIGPPRSSTSPALRAAPASPRPRGPPTPHAPPTSPPAARRTASSSAAAPAARRKQRRVGRARSAPPPPSRMSTDPWLGQKGCLKFRARPEAIFPLKI